jgi:hypothetical protein
MNYMGHEVDIVTVLLDPSRDQKKNERLQKVRNDIAEKEGKELTYHPQTNRRGLFGKTRASTTGDVNIDLYL